MAEGTQNTQQSSDGESGFHGQERVNPCGVLMYVRAGSRLCSAQLGLRAFVPGYFFPGFFAFNSVSPPSFYEHTLKHRNRG